MTQDETRRQAEERLRNAQYNNGGIVAEYARLLASVQELEARLARMDSFDQMHKRPVSFAALMDGIDSKDLEARIYELVIWHIRRGEAAEHRVAELEREVARLEDLLRKHDV